MKQAFREPDALLAYLGMDAASLPYAVDPSSQFPLRIPRYFADLIDPEDPDDPILAQVLPRQLENQPVAGYTADPLQELNGASDDGIIHKYTGRALVVAAGACAVHCRYCFRRHFPYADQALGRSGLASALARIERDPSIHEVILSGGDPLMLDDVTLNLWLRKLAAKEQIDTIRLHTRMPVVLPARITPALANSAAALDKSVVMVLHANHPNELSPTLAEALQPLRDAGVILLNQSVLLAGVNDSLGTLRSLSQKLVGMGVLPYYLHQLDPVAGAAHFQVADSQATRLHAALRDSAPGYWVPKLVREIPGAHAKQPLPESPSL